MDAPSTIKAVSWRDIFPWLIILRTLPIAISLSVWVLAMIAVVIVPVGWIVAETIFLNNDIRQQDPAFAEFVQYSRSPFRGVLNASSEPYSYVDVWGARLAGPQMAFQRLIEPVRRLFDMEMGFRKFCYLVVGSIWTIAVWSFCGCAIARICLLRLTQDGESAGLDDGLRFATARATTVLTAIGMPLGGVIVATIPCALLGLLMTFDFGAVLAGLLWFVAIGLGGVMAVLLLGLMFGWPLMVCAVSAENQNWLDGVTRAYAYVLQRPIHYVFYAAVCVLVGGICWLIIAQLAVGAIQMAYWSTSWGANVANGQRVEQFTDDARTTVDVQAIAASQAVEPGVAAESMTFRLSKRLIGFWNGLVSTVAVAFLFGQFWCLASAVYLLLRYDVDETELDEVYVEEPVGRIELPPLKSNADGIPVVKSLENPEGPLDETQWKS